MVAARPIDVPPNLFPAADAQVFDNPMWPPKAPHPAPQIQIWATFSICDGEGTIFETCPFANEVGEGGSRLLARDG